MRPFVALMVSAVALLCASVVWSTASAHSSVVPAEKTLRCGEINGFHAAPPRGWRVVLGRVALPPVGWLRSGAHHSRDSLPLPWYAKAGLEVRADRPPFDLVVPTRWRGRLALGWGEDDAPRFASVIHVPSCAPVLGRAWVWWAGGYFLRAPACVPVVVRSAACTAQLRLAIGRACR